MHFTLQGKTELGLRAIRVLADEGQTMSGPVLAEVIGTTANYLPQVMSPLVAAGWVSSGRGPTGGYRLQPSGRGITMLALIEASEGSLSTDKCVLQGGPCEERNPCELHDSWQRVQQTVVTELDRIPVL